MRRLAICTFAVLGLIALSGCDPTVDDGVAAERPEQTAQERPTARGFFSGLITPARPTPTEPLAEVRLVRGDVVVSATNGYCIDPETLVTRGARGFAMLASCRILSGGKTGPFVTPALITVTVGPKGSGANLPQPETLAAISEAALLEGRTEDGLVLARLGSGGQEVLAGGDPKYWRAAFVQGSRLVVLALYAPKGSAVTGASGRGLLTQVYDSIRAKSPGGAS